MASSGYGQAQPDPTRGMIAHTKTLLNAQLKQVLSAENLKVSGVKTDLQIRIISHIERLAHQGDYDGIQRVRRLLYGPYQDYSNHSSPSTSYTNHYTPPSSASPQYPPPMPTYGHRGGMPPYNSYSRLLTFKNSPFHEIKRPLSGVTECKARESTRDTARVNIDLPPDVADLLNRDSNYRVMVFCAADVPPTQPTDISFPHQVEMKCNGNEVKANLRGLKNKPGSTRPADITSFIKKRIAGSQNVLEMVYALTNKNVHAEQANPALQNYFLVVNLVRKVPVDNLVAQLKSGKAITKERVIKEMTSKAEDNDIQATSSVLSLKCPLSATRIVTPCRSISCAHNQCFDAASYLMLQEQAPQWTCPICNHSAPFNNLTVDLYVDNILRATSSNAEQVTIEPNGAWYLQKQAEMPRKPYSNPTPENDDGDLIEIQDDRIPALKADARSSIFRGTPPISSREPSSGSSAPRSSHKRLASEVIDLTISDDEEEPPQKMIKRPSISSLTSADPYRAPSASRYLFNLSPIYNTDYADSPL